MSSNDVLFGQLLSSQEAADLLGVPRTRVKQLAKDNELVVIRREGKQWVPSRTLELLDDDQISQLKAEAEDEETEFTGTHRPLWNLRGTVTVLRDSGFNSEEILKWLWTWNDELGADPISALEEGRHHHVNLVASVQGF